MLGKANIIEAKNGKDDEKYITPRTLGAVNEDNNKIIAELQKTISGLTSKVAELNKIPVGEFTLWEGNKYISNNGTFQWIGIRYSASQDLLNQFPTKVGYTRKHALVLDYSDNKTQGAVYIRLNSPNQAQEFLFPLTWGDPSDGVRRSARLNMNDGSPFTGGHVDIYCTPDFATGGNIRLYRLFIQVYDIPNN